jgi:hypothetical protein
MASLPAWGTIYLLGRRRRGYLLYICYRILWGKVCRPIFVEYAQVSRLFFFFDIGSACCDNAEKLMTPELVVVIVRFLL